MKSVTAPMLLLIACRGAYSQAADSRPAFEAASVRPAPAESMEGSSGWMRGGPGTNDPARFSCGNMSLASLLTRAYGIMRVQLSGPGWLDTEKFNIAAKVPQGATPAQFRLMLQDLLAERFKMTVRRETKEMMIYELVVGKNGPRVKESAAAPAPAEATEASPDQRVKDADGYPVFQAGESGGKVADHHGRMQYPRISMAQFASELSWAVGRPVKDGTALRGTYDFAVSWVPDSAPIDIAGPRLFAAIQDQLGLKVEQKKGLVDAVVIIHIEKAPTEN